MVGLQRDFRQLHYKRCFEFGRTASARRETEHGSDSFDAEGSSAKELDLLVSTTTGYLSFRPLFILTFLRDQTRVMQNRNRSTTAHLGFSPSITHDNLRSRIPSLQANLESIATSK